MIGSGAARTLREINSFTRDDGTPLNYTLVNIKDWCKNSYEVINQLRINTDNSVSANTIRETGVLPGDCKAHSRRMPGSHPDPY